MSRNICKDKKQFFKTVLESVRNADSDYCTEYEKFEDIPRSKWKHVLEEYLYDIVYSETAINSKNINVDCENVGMGGEYIKGGLKGLCKISTGELFYAFDCGGDWEEPVNAILYVEDEKVKFYAPERGNNFCIEHMCAWGSQPDSDNNDNESHVKKIDRDAELKDIEDYFHNRKEGEHSMLSQSDNEPKNNDTMENEEKSLLSSRTTYCVTMNTIVLKTDGREIYPRHSATVCHFVENVEEARKMALGFLYDLYCKEAKEPVEEDVFTVNPGKYISIIENGDKPKYGDSLGFVHIKSDGVEQWQGYDTCGNYPCLIADIIITTKNLWLSNDVTNISFSKYSTAKEVEQKEKEEDERHALNQECIDSFNRKFKESDAANEMSEYERIMDILGNNNEKDDK